MNLPNLPSLPNLPNPDPPVRRSSGGGDLAFAAVVTASYLAMFSAVVDSINPLRIVLLVVAGSLYIVLGIYGYTYCVKSGSRLALIAYFVIQIPLSGLIVFLGKGAGFNALLMLPLVGHAVILLSRTWAYTVCGAITVAYVIATSSFHPPITGIGTDLITFVAGMVFVLVFTQATVEEEKSHAEVERLAHELQGVNAKLREYAVQAEELAITKERNRLAREIHDGLGHYLTIIHMQIQAVQAITTDKDPRVQEALEHARDLSQEALAEIRQSVSALRATPGETRPLTELLTGLVNENQLSGMATFFQIIGEIRPLTPQIELTLYRAVQEGLNNVRKHSAATRVEVLLDYNNSNFIRLRIEDDGSGSENPSGGFGLMGLRERAHLLNGQVNTITRPGEGFILEVEIPG